MIFKKQLQILTSTSISTSAMNINDLPDDDLRCILLHFSLQQLLTLRLVCRNWQAVIEEICAAKRSLKIFASIGNVVTYVRCLADFHLTEEAAFRLRNIGADDDLLETVQLPKEEAPNQHQSQQNEIEMSSGHWPLRSLASRSRSLREQFSPSSSENSVPSADHHHHHLLSSLLLQGEEHIFPKVEQLTFFKHSFNCRFTAFSQLSSLTLNCQFVAGFTRCLQQLSQLSTLKSLHLLRVGFELNEAVRRVPDSAQLVFGRLEELSVCGCFDHSSISVDFLRLLGPEARKLMIKLPTIDYEEFAAICEEATVEKDNSSTFCPHLITSLSLDGLVDGDLPFGRQIALHCRFIETICEHFTGLQQLQLGLMREVTHHQVAPSLARLPKLRSLTLLRHFWVTENVNQAAGGNLPVVGTLLTVKTLHLICSSNNSFNYASLSKFSLIFPSLTTLKVSGDEEVLAKFRHHLGKRDEQSSFSSSVLSPSVEVKYSRLGDTIDYLGRHQVAYRRYIDELVAQIAEILRTWFRAKVRRGPGHRLLFKLLFFFLGFMVAILVKVFIW